MSKSCVGVLVVAAAGAVGASVCGVPVARAQGVSDPSFGFEKPPEKPVDWKVQAKAGGMLTTGNVQSKVVTATLDASRQSGQNKVSLNGTAAYGTSNNTFAPVPSAGDPTMVDGLARTSTTSTNEWKARGRYDRFLTPNNSAYGAGLIGANRVAGKRLYGGGQVGYSRQLVKNERHTLVAELGYDFSYESYVPVPGKTLDGVSIHSARVFAGELWSLSKDTGINVSAEALFNLNKETGALDSSTGQPGVDAFKDTRLVAKAGLSTRLFQSLSLAVGFTWRYDQNPAPISPPALPMGLTYVANFQPFARSSDTLSEVTLIYTFL